MNQENGGPGRIRSFARTHDVHRLRTAHRRVFHVSLDNNRVGNFRCVGRLGKQDVGGYDEQCKERNVYRVTIRY
jgi:hypothetical protein